MAGVTSPDLCLVVLRSTDVSGSRAIFSALGLTFVDEQHGAGPAHCSATLEDGTVIEIYPTTATAVELTRLGFEVADVRTAVEAAVDAGAQVVGEPSSSYALIEDVDGRRVEIRERIN
jgi:hypothetical protein